jgi:F0F1-type ATP synthase membrane subunit c/vacuolar-type H+-ATPase subunit K
MMTEQKLEQGMEANVDDDNGQQTLKKAIIAFAIVEALVLIPIILYMIFR